MNTNHYHYITPDTKMFGKITFAETGVCVRFYVPKGYSWSYVYESNPFDTHILQTYTDYKGRMAFVLFVPYNCIDISVKPTIDHELRRICKFWK